VRPSVQAALYEKPGSRVFKYRKRRKDIKKRREARRFFNDRFRGSENRGKEKQAMTNQTIAEAEELAAEIIEFTGSVESRLFYLKSIYALGPGLVREAVGEVRYRDNRGEVDDRARYLTRVLNRWMAEQKADTEPVTEEARPLGQGTPPRPLAQKPFGAFRKLPLPGPERPVSKLLDVPFSRRHLQWVRDLNNDFFSLTNEKADSDKVETNAEINGMTIPVTLMRGKQTPDDKPQGIPTVEDMRVLLALEKIWAEGRGPHDDRICTFETTAAAIAEAMGITNGGKILGYITKKVLKLSRTGYCFVFPKTPGPNGLVFEDFGFRFLGDVTTLTRVVNGHRERYFRVSFSEPYSRQLLARNVVSRPADMLHVRGDIAFKLYVHLYPILAGLPEGRSYSIELLRLLPLLRLKQTGWWMYKSQRKREFDKAMRELNGRPGKDGHIFDIRIEQGINPKDFMLEARFVNSSKGANDEV
jgi:hypothetical protein